MRVQRLNLEYQYIQICEHYFSAFLKKQKKAVSVKSSVSCRRVVIVQTCLSKTSFMLSNCCTVLRSQSSLDLQIKRQRVCISVSKESKKMFYFCSLSSIKFQAHRYAGGEGEGRILKIVQEFGSTIRLLVEIGHTVTSWVLHYIHLHTFNFVL